MTTKKSKKQSPLQRAISNQLHRSHERLLEEALEVTPEVTDFEQLKDMYPDYDEDKIYNIQRLNMKINAANDFLIEEQSAWLDPSSRPTGVFLTTKNSLVNLSHLTKKTQRTFKTKSTTTTTRRSLCYFIGYFLLLFSLSYLC